MLCSSPIQHRIIEETGKRSGNANFLQKRVSSRAQFPCNVENFRSRIVPTSVHQLRPGELRLRYTQARNARPINYVFLYQLNRIQVISI